MTKFTFDLPDILNRPVTFRLERGHGIKGHDPEPDGIVIVVRDKRALDLKVISRWLYPTQSEFRTPTLTKFYQIERLLYTDQPISPYAELGVQFAEESLLVRYALRDKHWTYPWHLISEVDYLLRQKTIKLIEGSSSTVKSNAQGDIEASLRFGQAVDIRLKPILPLLEAMTYQALREIEPLYRTWLRNKIDAGRGQVFKTEV